MNCKACQKPLKRSVTGYCRNCFGAHSPHPRTGLRAGAAHWKEWLPIDMRPLYQTLTRSKRLSAAEAKRIVTDTMRRQEKKYWVKYETGRL